MIFSKINLAQSGNIVEVLATDRRFEILLDALVLGGLVETLEGPGPFTLFAPTNEAFRKLPERVIADLLKPENKAKLVKVLTYHVVGGEALTTADIIRLKPPFELQMFNNITTNITKNGATIQINDATVIQGDINATNGIIQAIDTVLIPKDINETAVAHGRLQNLVTILKNSDLLKPENKQKLNKVLPYHVVVGKQAMTTADII